MTELPIVLNQASGAGHADDAVRELEELFVPHGLKARVLPAKAGEGLLDRAREAIRGDPPIVVAAGGDGTVSGVASLLRGRPSALGILPMGTLNHFARDLGIPLDLKAAAETIATGQTIDVDMGEVNGRTFVNNASLGLYPEIVRHRQRRQRQNGHGKYWAMLWATLSVLGRSPFLKLGLEVDGNSQRCRSPFVFVGNNDYTMEGFNIGTRASVRDGRLSVYTTRRHGRAPLLRLALRALLGRLHQADDFSNEQAQRVRVASERRRLLVATDGEVTAMDTPLEFKVRPRSLRVRVPKD